MKKGFTLIELLVVVLIIGILAAIALPQYEKAVEKSKSAQALTLMKTVYQAAQAYYLANGTYATSFDDLGIDIPWTDKNKSGTITDARNNEEWSARLLNKSSDDSKQNAIHIRRLSGKYIGAGFEIYLHHNATKVPRNVLFCIEGYNDSNLKFEKPRGAYCSQIMNAKYIHQGDPNYYFTFDNTQWGS